MANGNGNDLVGSLGQQYYSPMTDRTYPMASGSTTNPLMPAYAGDPEAAGAAQVSSLMAPAVRSYLNDVFSGRMFERGMERYFGQPTPDPSQPLSQQANLTMDSPAVNIGLSVGPGIIAGPKALTAELRGATNEPWTLEQAQKMEAGTYPYNQPLDRDEIFQRSGWFRGVDDQWKYIIPDKGAQLNTSALKEINYTNPGGLYRTAYTVPAQGVKLGDLLQHDDLYAAYPWLADVNVRPLTDRLGSGINGAYLHDTNTMLLSPKELDDLDMMKSTILHESQHAVQSVEGFASGGSAKSFLPATFDDDFLANARERSNVESEIKAAGYKPDMVAAEHGLYPYMQPELNTGYVSSGYSSGLDPDILSRYKSVMGRRAAFADLQNAARVSYHNLAGEVEARSTQAMDLLQRWDLPPWQAGELGYDRYMKPTTVPYTPESQQLVRFRHSGSIQPEIPEGLPTPPDGWGYTPVDHDPFAPTQGQGQ